MTAKQNGVMRRSKEPEPDSIPLMSSADLDLEADGDTEHDSHTNKKPPGASSKSMLSHAWFGFSNIKTRVLQQATRRTTIFAATILMFVCVGFVFFRKPSPVHTGSLRPNIHFAARPGTWLNDPNGLFVSADGFWHM
jgi:hypothetical protein